MPRRYKQIGGVYWIHVPSILSHRLARQYKPSQHRCAIVESLRDSGWYPLVKERQRDERVQERASTYRFS